MTGKKHISTESRYSRTELSDSVLFELSRSYYNSYYIIYSILVHFKLYSIRLL